MASNNSPPGSRKRKRPSRSPGSACDNSEPRLKSVRKNCSEEISPTCLPSGSSQAVTANRIGTIEKISLKNFMCHSQLEFAFGSRVNFIIGRNGSGKSAVLTAVMAGLGGKASVTNRGSKISALIQKGRPSARIEVTLTNTGPDAYKPGTFGPTISIVRTIRAVGGSYEIRSHDRRVVSTKREDLQSIMAHMNIQVDNPIVVLNQETSRNFLQSKSAKDKYVFFLKATQLETVKANYEEAEENARQATNLFKSKRTILPVLENDVKKYETILKLIDDIVDSKTKLEVLKAELCWSRVVSHERQVAQATQHFEKFQLQLQQLDKDTASLEDNLSVASADLTRYGDELSALNQTRSAQIGELDERKRHMDAAKQKFREGEDVEKKIVRSIRFLETDKVSLENEIERAKANSSEEWKKEKDRRTKEIAVVEEKLAVVRTEEHEANRREMSAREEVKKKDAEMRELAIELKKVSTGCQRISYQIQTVKAAKSNAVNRFGARTADILREISAQSRFRVKPKGPVGSFVQLTDERWAYALERHCSSTLTAYMVDNNDDAKLLKQIFDKFGQRNITMFTRKFSNRRYECPVASPVAGSRCLVDVVKVADADVFNLLVDVHAINQVLLFDNVETALSTLKRAENVPRHCSLALDAAYNRVSPAPKYRMLSNDRPLQVHLFKESGDQLPALDRELRQMRETESASEKQLNRVQKELASLELDVRRAQEARSRLSADAARCQATLRDLRDFEEPVAVNASLLENEIEKLSRSIEAKRSELPQATENLQALREAVREKNRALKEAELVVKESDEKIRLLEVVVNKCRDKVEKFKSYAMNIDSKRAALAKLRDERQLELEAKQVHLDNATKAAAETFPKRVSTTRSENTLQIEIETLCEQIASMERTQPDPERTRETYSRLKEKFDTLSGELRELKTYLKELDLLIKQRRETYIKVRDLACFRVNTVFQSLMASENFTASLVFEHDERRLQIDVKETGHSERQSQRDVRGLSGGERSFSTVCFICALWSSTDHTPFRVLDEFDIFMDMSKRRKSLQMLLEICQKQARCQFIFLTPLEMPNIDALKDASVKIQMMPEPERGSLAVH